MSGTPSVTAVLHDTPYLVSFTDDLGNNWRADEPLDVGGGNAAPAPDLRNLDRGCRRIVDPALAATTPVQAYAPQSWGPADAMRVAPPGGWSDPKL